MRQALEKGDRVELVDNWRDWKKGEYAIVSKFEHHSGDGDFVTLTPENGSEKDCYVLYAYMVKYLPVEPMVGDIIINKNPYDGEAPYLLFSTDKDGSFKAAQGLGKYNSDGWTFDCAQIMEVEQINQSYKKIGFVSLS